MRFGQIIYFGMIVRMGTDVYAAHTLAGNFTIFASVIGTGFTVAITTLVGKSLGVDDWEQAKGYSHSSIKLTGMIMTGTLLLVFLVSPKLSMLFTSEPKVVTW